MFGCFVPEAAIGNNAIADGKLVKSSARFWCTSSRYPASIYGRACTIREVQPKLCFYLHSFISHAATLWQTSMSRVPPIGIVEPTETQPRLLALALQRCRYFDRYKMAGGK